MKDSKSKIIRVLITPTFNCLYLNSHWFLGQFSLASDMHLSQLDKMCGDILLNTQANQHNFIYTTTTKFLILFYYFFFFFTEE